jgi:hypothetical protein
LSTSPDLCRYGFTIQTICPVWSVCNSHWQINLNGFRAQLKYIPDRKQCTFPQYKPGRILPGHVLLALFQTVNRVNNKLALQLLDTCITVSHELVRAHNGSKTMKKRILIVSGGRGSTQRRLNQEQNSEIIEVDARTDVEIRAYARIYSPDIIVYGDNRVESVI